MQVFYFARKVDAAEWKPPETPPDVVIFEDEAFVPAGLRAARRYAATSAGANSAQHYRQCLQDVAAFAYAPCKNGNPLIEHLTINGQEHWFYLRMSLFYRYHSIFASAQRILLSLKEAGVMPGSITALHVFHNQPALPALLPQSLPLRLYMPAQATKAGQGKTPTWYMVQYLFMFLIRALLGIWQLRLALSKKPKNVLVTDPEMLQPLTNPQNPNATVLTDTYLGYLLERVKNRPDFLVLSEIQPPRLENARRRRIERRLLVPAYGGKTLHFDVFTFFTLLHPATWLQLYRAKQQLKSIRPHTSLSPAQRCLFELLPGVFPLILQGVFRYRAARLFARMVPVATIAAPNEHAVNNKPLSDAVKERNGISIGIQHGALSVFYQCFHPNDTQYHHLPHYTIFWGSYYLQSLGAQNGNYHAQNTACLGQLRTDAIPALLHTLQKAQLHPSLSNHVPLLLYLPQPLVGAEQPLRQQIATDFLLLHRHFPHCQLAIKPHPLETDHRFFYDIANQCGNPPFLLLTQELYKLLAVADVVITYHSTAGAEAVYFKKPLLVANYLQNDAAGYLQQGIALGYQNAAELVQLVAGILNGTQCIDAQKQQTFIENRAFAIDGQTATRYLEFILTAKPPQQTA
ncbi:hypothetical protein C7N43_35960 [Sphingobacteriales bacterium UPWRP_1]|nr:hypothetical protein BVG80_02180 [Sphingobacteriales bacterium TSM_CSM]PSJ72106.1 hypothetical protein C7N43_35960 [Sphingobacteriales bacterium UPWRP_1]